MKHLRVLPFSIDDREPTHGETASNVVRLEITTMRLVDLAASNRWRNHSCATLFAAVVCVLCVLHAAANDDSPDVVFVPTPHDVVAKMLELVNVGKDDVVYDLGCGDGRIVATAARWRGCKGVGFDISSVRVKESRATVEELNVGHLVSIEQKNIFDLDLKQASVITLYLLPSLNTKLVPQFEAMKPGSRIVSHAYDIDGVEPDKTVEMISREDNAEHTIYLWTIPLKKAKNDK